ncbi:MAG: FMN-binding protein [Lentimicrobium sp.]|nr:FMN-binding protein [Lentimicrobium sp.]
MKTSVKILLLIFLSAFTIISDGPQLSRESLKKLNKSISELYPGLNVEFIKLNLSNPSISDPEILSADGKWFAIQNNGLKIGWLMVNKTQGRYHEFEFAMIVDTTRKINNVSILSYPASHGNAVTGKKWLKRFSGFSPDSLPVYGSNVDALSGATISGSNLTNSVANALKIMKKLEEQKLLK